MRSEELFRRSEAVSPGGVSSPVRAFSPYPLFMRSASGCRIRDVDGKEYVDLCMAYGPLIAGHSCPDVHDAIRGQLSAGTLYGTPSEPELALIEEIVSAVPSADMVRLACSGTEATMHAIRTARGFTGRDGVVKMNGGYHGAHDAVLVTRDAGFGNVRPMAGVPAATAGNTFITEYNNIESLSHIVEKEAPACVIMEPVLGNVGVVPPGRGYLEEVRKITAENGVVLIFDEVITGFRLSPGGAQGLYGVIPDMTTCGKIIGGGLSGSAFMGKKEIMEHVAPSGKVFAAGTYAGNPLSSAAGLALIRHMRSADRYAHLNRISDLLRKFIEDLIEDTGVRACINGVGSMMCLYFGRDAVLNGRDASAADRDMFGRFFKSMLEAGVYAAPSALEDWFLSTAHTEEDMAVVENALSDAVGGLK